MQLELISRMPQAGARETPLLFVHGAWHGAWCWDVHFLDFFAQRGFASHALSLRGHGGSEGRGRLRFTRASEYVEDVAEIAAGLPRRPVVIGHSMGGYVVQKYLERHGAPAAVLLASVPPSGVWRTTLRSARRHPLLFAKANATMSLYPLVATPALAREAFFSDGLDDASLRDYASRLQDESFLGFLDMLALDLPRRPQTLPPTLVVGGELDTVFHVDEVEATARKFGTKAEIFPGLAHDMMLEPGWEKVAARIAGWLAALPRRP